ncbi:IclR family transcriptional regulator [Rhodoplanes roseus]|uniref:IclR family transcriptional regulator n=1 Tax=Rhodoplanes roseus TaxID=29409 RepID=A0A327L4X8_9BRAD|nr:IclR family transcriptional regulator [Rhodoplanes roseus]RAI45989.1 hypothetical protein CH341_01365 [Rhodoplanes roseus]
MEPDTHSSRKTIDKAMRVLTAFSSEHPELAIGELSARLGLHKSVTSRLVSALCDWGMLERNPQSQRVRIGEAAFRIGSLFSPRDHLVRVAAPHMDALVAATGQSNHLTVLDGHRFLVVATVESPSALRVIMRLGERRPLHATAAGKLFLAASDALLDAVAAAPMEAFTPHTPATPAKLRKAVALVHRQGIAWNTGESSIGAGAVAAPVYDRSGRMIAALSTVYPLQVVSGPALARVGDATRAAARKISQELGAEPQP